MIFNTSILRGEERLSDFRKRVLDNGATVVCNYVPDSPLVAIQIRVLSGLSNEGRYAGSGISHFLEHLLFKGTHDKTADEVRGEIKMLGGDANGSTGMDSAEYHILVPRENFDKALTLLTDMVMDLSFTDEELEKEREVVLKEIMLRADDPSARRIRLLFSQAYMDHVYKYPIIGYEERFKKLTREDLLRYHGAAYTPDRMVIGVSGGVPPGVALKAVENKFNTYQRGEVWPVDILSEPKQLDEKVSRFPADITLGYMAVGFHTSSLYSADLYPADVLSILLGEGNDSRFYRKLVKEKELLYNVASMNYTPRYPGLFVIVGIGEPEKLEEAREEIFAVIEELKSGRVKDEEVERAKTIVISRYLYSQESVKSLVSSITSSELMTGDPSFYRKYVEELKKVGKWQVKNTAMQYMNRDNSTTVFLLPRPLYMEETAEEEQEKITEKIKNQGFADLENGLRVAVMRRSELPLVSVSLVMPGGLRAETRGLSGLSTLTASMILKGTKRRKEEEIIPAFEKMGGVVNGFSGVNSMGVSMKLLSGDLDEGLDILEDVIKNPIFPEEELDKQKRKTLASIREQEKSIFDKALLEFRSLLYGDHSYGMRILGEADTVKWITREEVVDFYTEHWGPEKAVMTVVGDVDVGATLDNIIKRFEDWAGACAAIEAKGISPPEQPRKKDISMQKEQSLILLGFLGVEVADERKYPLQILSSILSGADGMLFHTLREQQGFTYTSGAISVPAVEPGYFLLYAATSEENIDDVKKEMQALVRKVIKGDITWEEIEAAKNRLITYHTASMETNSSVSMTMAIDELYGLGFENYKIYPDKIRAVTLEDIKQAARDVIDLSRSVETIVHSD
ncbi:MAG: pitrilysin family protein [Candidatus Omnitrophota bacterium]